MKYIIVLGDGMADEPLAELCGKTPLEVANTPALDELTKKSEIGLAYTVPKGMSPGSDTANLSVIGYNPEVYYTGRSPLEALSIGVDMKPTDISLRCNIVTISEEEQNYEDHIIIDHSASEISTKDAAVLIQALQIGLRREGYEFYVGTSYRHLLQRCRHTQRAYTRRNGKCVSTTPVKTQTKNGIANATPLKI